MDIYDDDLRLDHDKATTELRAVPAISNKEARQASLDYLRTATLIDIADSLRTLAVEAALSMAHNGALDGLEPDVEPPSNAAEFEIAPGMRVKPRGADGALLGTLTGANGVDQGAVWAGVIWDGEEEESRVWVSDLEPDVEPGDAVDAVAALKARQKKKKSEK